MITISIKHLIMGHELQFAEIIMGRFVDPDGEIFPYVTYGDICTNVLERNARSTEVIKSVLAKLETNGYITPYRDGYRLSDKGYGYFRTKTLSLRS